MRSAKAEIPYMGVSDTEAPPTCQVQLIRRILAKSEDYLEGRGLQ